MERGDWKRPLDRAAHEALSFLEQLPERHVGPTVGFEETLARIDRPLPTVGLEPSAVVGELVEATRDALMASVSGGFYGFVMGGTLPAALAADWLTSTWDQNTALGAVTPGTAAVERVAGRWLLEALRLPEQATVGFTTGCQVAHLTCLAVARGAVLRQVGWDVESDGLQGAPAVTVLIGDEAHDTVPRALRFLGLGAEAASRIPTDAEGRMDVAALRAALAGVDGPTIVIAQVGNVHSGAIDPMEAVADAVDEHRRRVPATWLHVDGAFGLWLRASDRRRELTSGVERADSWATDAHKWLNVPYDCGAAIVAHPAAHSQAMDIHGAYLPESQRLGSRDPMDLVPEMSRRGRATPVYAALRQLGGDGLEAMTDRLCDLAGHLADRMRDEPGVEVMNEVVLNQVVLAFGDARHTEAVAVAVQREGGSWVGPSTWRGRPVIRVSIQNWSTTVEDIDRLIVTMLGAHAA